MGETSLSPLVVRSMDWSPTLIAWCPVGALVVAVQVLRLTAVRRIGTVRAIGAFVIVWVTVDGNKVMIGDPCRN